MNTQDNAAGDQPGWWLLLMQSALIGAFTGVVVGLFRYLNDHITLYFVRTVGHPLDQGVGMAIIIFGALFVFALLSIFFPALRTLDWWQRHPPSGNHDPRRLTNEMVAGAGDQILGGTDFFSGGLITGS
ncbi:MAG TPA: hypothetical protein VK049_01955 [Paenalcaligenes sp.]|nr:hypothetical protein [Paenalcaligenes sp.]